MPLQTGDYITIKDYQTLFQQQVLNVYTFRVNAFSGDSSYDSLLQGFELFFIDTVRSFQAPELTHTRLEVDNLTNGLEFASRDVGKPGSGTGTSPSPPFVTLSIRLSRSTKVTRNGYKRYAGLDEAQYTDGIFQAGTITNWQDNVANVLEAPFTFASGGLWSFTLEHVIIGRDPVTGDYDLARVNEISSAIVQPNVTTQNTRKFGRGS